MGSSVTQTVYITADSPTITSTVDAISTALATTTPVSTTFKLQRRDAPASYVSNVAKHCTAQTNSLGSVTMDPTGRMISACACIMATPISTSTNYIATVTSYLGTSTKTESPTATITTTTTVSTASTLSILSTTKTLTSTDVHSSTYIYSTTYYTTYVAKDFVTSTQTHYHTDTVTETSTATATSTDFSTSVSTTTVATSTFTHPPTTTFEETTTVFTATTTVTVQAAAPTVLEVFCGKKALGSPSPALDEFRLAVSAEAVYTVSECHARCAFTTDCQGASHDGTAKVCTLYSVALTSDNFKHDDGKTHWGWSSICPKEANGGPQEECGAAPGQPPVTPGQPPVTPGQPPVTPGQPPANPGAPGGPGGPGGPGRP